MNLLLDTHALIWFGENDPRLSKKAIDAIESANHSKYISIVSLWEMSIKSSLGKLQLNTPLNEIIEALQPNGFNLMPITSDHVLAVEKLPYFHRDPFDRMLIAQTISEGFTIISNEVLFDEYGLERLW